MWRLLQVALGRQVSWQIERAFEHGQLRLRRILAAYLVAQIGVYLTILSFGFLLLALFFHLGNLGLLVEPALWTALVAAGPVVVCLVLSRRLFRT